MTFELKIADISDEERPSPEDVRVPDTTVDIAYPTNGSVHAYFHQAVLKAFEYDKYQRWNNIATERAKYSGANISKARNQLVTDFLSGDSEWLFFLDGDMVIEEETIPRLLCAAECSGADVIGGLCVMEGPNGPLPTIYQFGDFSQNEVTRILFDYPEGQIMQVAATGTACLLIKRCVLEHIRDLHPDDPYPWFKEQVINRQWISEDIYFCLQANSLDHPVFVDCTTPVGHAKGRKVWKPEDIRKGTGFPDAYNVAIVPVKDRLDLTSNIVEELRKQSGLDDIVILDNGSGKKTKNWLASQKDINVYSMPDAGIHEMWNQGVDHAMMSGQKRNVNLIFLNNDVHLENDYFVEDMVSTLRSDRDLIAVGANYDGRTIDGPWQEVTDMCYARYDGSGGFPGFAFATGLELFLSGYKFPEELQWWFGDNDLVNTIRMSGGKVGISGIARCEHVDGGGQTGGDPTWSDPKWDEMKRSDREFFEKKWKGVKI